MEQVKEKRFLNAADVSEILECSKTKSYEIIRQLNAELKAMDKVVIAGKVNSKYFFEKIYDGVQS